MKLCKLCGQPFEPRTNAQRICDRTHYRECRFCGKKFAIKCGSDSQRCCSKECTQKLREQTMIERYGVAHALESKQFVEKAEQTQLERYGVKHAAQNEDIKKRTQQQFFEKHGVRTPFELPDFQEKATNTCLKKYGVKFTSQIPGRTEKMQATNLKRYGSKAPIGNPEISARFQADMMERFGVPYYCMTDECRRKQRRTISSVNKKFMAKLEDVGLECIPEGVKLNRFSYDVYVPSLNTVIEINPTYTHNMYGNHWGTKLPKEYHRDKTKLAREHGYRCINVWDWDDIDKVVEMLKPKVPVYARKCFIQEIDSKTADEFETLYHLQGKVRGQKVCLGLYYQGELIQLMTFGKPRYNKNYEWELLRLCSNSKYAVVGGAERLWKYFISHNQPKSVISYCDMSKFDGAVYERLGMKLKCVNKPNTLWSFEDAVITNNFLLQHGFDQIFGTDYGKGTSNEELMLIHGWLPMADCGQAVYIYESL